MRSHYVLLFLIGMLTFGAACGEDSSSNPSPSPTAAATGNPITGTSDLPQADEPVELNPADFVAEIGNPYFPMRHGYHWVYTETDDDGTERNVDITVTTDTKVIAGINATVVHDIVAEDGEIIENTFDWYAQDTEGNVWYLGEDTEEYEDGQVVSTAGSWEHGVDGAMAGLIMPANPQPGLTYRQEYYAGEAEDRGRVLSIDEQVDIDQGSYTDVVQTEDTTPLEPDVLEHKFYAQGVGLLVALDVNGGGREELILFENAP